MKSGLGGRNNRSSPSRHQPPNSLCLNEVRPRRPEQFRRRCCRIRTGSNVSMKSGLRDRNNHGCRNIPDATGPRVSMKSGFSDRNNRDNPICENPAHLVSMKSDLRDQNNSELASAITGLATACQWSPVLETGTIRLSSGWLTASGNCLNEVRP